MKENNLRIAEGERLYIDGVELTSVEHYELIHSAGNAAELTVKMVVTVNQVVSEREK